MKLLGYNLKLKQQLLVFFLIFAVVPSLTVTIITVISNDSTVKESESEIESLQIKTLTGLADQYADLINSWIHEQSQTVDIIASDPTIRVNIELLSNSSMKSYALHQIDMLFDAWVSSSGSITEMMLLDYSTGDVILSMAAQGLTNSTTNKANDPYFTGAKSTQGTNLATGSVYFKEIYYSTDANSFMMTFSHVIRPMSSDTATPLGILVTRVDPNSLWNLIAPRDAQNRPIDNYYNNIGLGETGEAFLINYEGLAISRSRFSLIDKNFILVEDFSTDNGFKNAKSIGYEIGLETAYNLDEVYGAYVYLGTQTTSTDARDSFLVSKLDFDLDWVLAIEIDKSEVMIPINHIRDQQNTSLLFILGVITAITALVSVVSIFIANSFSKPISKLSSVSQAISVGDLSIKVDKSTKDDEIGDLQNAFTTMINFLKPSVDAIASVAKTLAASAQEMASSSEEVNASSEEMSSVSQQISKGAQQQSEYLNNSMRQMEDIQKQFIEKIGGIKIASELIESISTQVNMLALNASIEAARAGEYGRGFAVVADNIRRLADDAKSSVDRVNMIINDLTTTITTGMGSLNSSIVSVTTVAEETASGAEEASAATEEQAATMEELSASAQELAKVSVDLEEIVRRFKI
jgi:methyl-accepting chemotaxis protein